MSQPILLAHRGWASRYPENSRLGIEAALRAGVACVEFDVQLSADCVPVADIIVLLQDWPKAKAFVEIKRESAEAHGVDATVALVLDVLAPVRERCIVISFVERAVMTARRLGASATGWILNHYDDDSRSLAEAMAPDYLICDYRKLPAAPATLWSGPWHWGSYEIVEVEHALGLVERGVQIIESMAAGDLASDPRLSSGSHVRNSA
jgi:glycerophosphoryl diester phosphodiesterase